MTATMMLNILTPRNLLVINLMDTTKRDNNIIHMETRRIKILPLLERREKEVRSAGGPGQARVFHESFSVAVPAMLSAIGSRSQGTFDFISFDRLYVSVIANN